MIDHKYKIISVEIPRTASSHRARIFANMPLSVYTSNEVADFYWKDIYRHATIIEYQKMYPEYFSEYFKFTFVRNPWDRMVSFYRYREKKYGEKSFKNYILKNKYPTVQNLVETYSKNV